MDVSERSGKVESFGELGEVAVVTMKLDLQKTARHVSGFDTGGRMDKNLHLGILTSCDSK